VQPNDGFTYIGRGLSQVTGRGNYAALDNQLGGNLGLVNNPALVNTTDNVTKCGVADFVLCGCLPFAKSDDVIEVSQRLNGGFVGFAERTEWLVKWKQALGITPAKSGTMLWVQQSLNTLGASPQPTLDSVYGSGSEAALKTFQVAHQLHTNGLPTRETIAAIKAALPSV
jgi:putative chitinase